MNKEPFLNNNELEQIKNNLVKTFESIIIPIWKHTYNKENTWQKNILNFTKYHTNTYGDKIPDKDSIVYNSIVKNEHYVDFIMVRGMIIFMNEECIDITDDQFEDDEELCEMSHWEFIDDIILFHYMNNSI
jgi:hypothetical protein